MCSSLWIQLDITQPICKDHGNPLTLGKRRSFFQKPLLLFALDVITFLCPGRSIFNTITSFDEFLKGFRASWGTLQLLFQFPYHLVASWIFYVFLLGFLARFPKKMKLTLLYCTCVLVHPCIMYFFPCFSMPSA